MTSSGGQFSGYLNEINRLKQRKEMMLKNSGFNNSDDKDFIQIEQEVMRQNPINANQI
jgi:hypothetical protein